MTRRIKGLISVLLRETGMIFRDKDLITIILLSPLFYAFFYASVYFYKSEQNVPVVVVDMDKSQMSQALLRSLDATQLADVNEVVPDMNSAMDRVYSLKSHGILYIPQGFEKSLKSGNGTDLKIYLNTTKFLISNDINKAVNEVTGTIGAGVKLKYFQMQGYNIDQAMEMIEPLSCEVKPLFNPVESYGDFMIPGILVLILQQTLLIGLAESVAKEREMGTLSELFTTANKSIWAAINGKGLFYFLMFSSYAFVFFTLNFEVFKINFRGSASAVAVFTGLFLAAIIYIAIFFASFFKRKIVALQVFAFTSYPFFLMSGYPWPVQALPVYLKYLSYLLPVTPYLNAFNRITQQGAGWRDVMPEFYHLLILAFCGLLLTRLRIKSLIKNHSQKKEEIEAAGIEFSGSN